MRKSLVPHEMHTTYKYLFSIIVAVYNVEKYLREAIDSLIDQSIGFAEHVQLILVNDGSSDASGSICLEYKNKYPHNICYIEKENGGASSAQNIGMDYAEGKFVNFLDSDDKLSPETLERVYRFFKDKEPFLDMVSIPMVYFEGDRGLHPKYELLGKRSRIVSLIREPHNFILSASSTFYRSSAIREKRFDESLKNLEDFKFNIELYKVNPQFGYLYSRKAFYRYRRRIDGGSSVDSVRYGSDTGPWIGAPTVFKDCFENRSLCDFEQESIAYVLRSMLRDLRVEYFENQADYDNLLEEYRVWISRLDDDFILRRSKFLTTKQLKDLFLRFKGSSLAEQIDSLRFDNDLHDVWIKSFKVIDGHCVIDCIYHRMGESELGLFIQQVSEIGSSIIAPTETKSLQGPFDLTVGEFAVDPTHYARFVLPVCVTKYRFVFRLGAYFHQARTVHINPRLPYSSKTRRLGRSSNGMQIFVRADRIDIDALEDTSLLERYKTMRRLHDKHRVWAKGRLFEHGKNASFLSTTAQIKPGITGRPCSNTLWHTARPSLKR